MHKRKEIFAIHVFRFQVNGNDRKPFRARVTVDSTWFIPTYIQCFAFCFSNLFIYSATLVEYLQYSGNLLSQKVDSTDNKKGVPSSIAYHSLVSLSLPFIPSYLCSLYFSSFIQDFLTAGTKWFSAPSLCFSWAVSLSPNQANCRVQGSSGWYFVHLLC